MSAETDWLPVTLDSGSRRGLADGIETHATTTGVPTDPHLLRMLRSSRNELLLDKGQAKLVLDVLNVDRRLSALRARLEAFLGLR